MKIRRKTACTTLVLGAMLCTAFTLSAQEVLTRGFLNVDHYYDVGTNVLVAGLFEHAKFPDSPDEQFYTPKAGVDQTNPDLSNFGARITGWVEPSVAGDYTFFLRSDDGSELYINETPGGDPPDILVAPLAAFVETPCCLPFQEPGSSQTTLPIALQAGQRYGITILMKEAGGGDYVYVAWRLAGDTTAAADLQPIPGANLWGMVDSTGHEFNIVQQPQSQTVVEEQTASVSVQIQTLPDPGEYSVQWLKDGQPIPGATGTSYQTGVLSVADSGAVYVARIYALTGVVDSDPATITVVPDTFGPLLAGATAFPGATKVGLVFDENLDVTSAQVAGNYQVNGAAVVSAVVRTNVANELTDEKNLVQLTVATPLNADFTVTVTGVQDVKGNAIASTEATGKIIDLTITDVGSPAGQPGGPDPQAPSSVATWGPGAYDVLTTGSNDYWNNADGFNFIWEPKTNSFDVKVRIVSVSPVNNWTAGAIMMREGPVTPNGGGWELARHYFIKADYGGPGAVPVLDGSGSGANQYEYNCRLAPGNPALRETSNDAPGGSVGAWGTGGTGAGGFGPVPFPNAWIRMARVKTADSDHLLGYNSTDGVNWELRRDIDLNDTNHAGFLNLEGNPAGPWPDVTYVGLASTSHTGVGNNNTVNNGAVGEFWYSKIGDPYSAFIIYRDYGDVMTTGTSPTVTVVQNSDGTITLNYTGALYSADVVTGPYNPVSGASSPFTVNPQTVGSPAAFYRAGP